MEHCGYMAHSDPKHKHSLSAHNTSIHTGTATPSVHAFTRHLISTKHGIITEIGIGVAKGAFIKIAVCY